MTTEALTVTLALICIAFAAAWWLRGRNELAARAARESGWAAERAGLQEQMSGKEAQTAVAQERVRSLTEQLSAAAAVAQTRAEAPEQVAEVMAPVKHALGKLEEIVSRSERDRTAATARMSERLGVVAQTATSSSDGLRRETARLVGALSRSDVRGKWGEFQLRQLMVASGLIPGVHFTEQSQVMVEERRLVPDVVIHIGADKDVVVDAKVSLRAILDAHADDSPEALASMRTAHAREVRAHVDRLASKEYASQFDSAPDYVVMFLPAESLLSVALEGDTGLLDHAFARNVILATPTTLMGLLRTVAHIWRQEEVAANAREIQALGRELADRMRSMLGHLDTLGSALTKSVRSYNSTVGSLETRVLVTGRRFTEMQGLAELAGPRQVGESTRNVVVALPAGGTAQERTDKTAQLATLETAAG